MSVWAIDPQDYPQEAPWEHRLRFLLRYAILAPSSHNSQPWHFQLQENQVDIRVDRDRWLIVADPEQRELYINQGCALENLLIAAEHFGVGCQVEYLPDPQDEDLAARVVCHGDAQPSYHRPPELFEVICQRQTSHSAHDARSLSENTLQRLQACCVEPGIYLYTSAAVATKRRLDELITQANRIQFADPAFRRELAYWVRLGVFGTSWLMSRLLAFLVTHVDMGISQSRRDSALWMSSPMVGILESDADDLATRIRVGQIYQRIALTAAALDLCVQPMSQTVEITEIRHEVAKLLPSRNRTPQQPFRLGYGPRERQQTPRRPLEEALQ